MRLLAALLIVPVIGLTLPIGRLVRETPGVRAVRLDLRIREGARPSRPQPAPDDDRIDKSALSAPLVPGRAPPPDPAGAP